MMQPATNEARNDTMRTLEQAITGQPDAISTAITSSFDAIRSAAVLLAGARRVRLCGAGASSFGAQVGEYMLRSIGLDARATHAFDLAAYPANFDPGDLVIVLSHRGADPYAARVLLRATHGGLKTIAITGEAGTLRGADVRIEVVPGDASKAKAASFTAGMAVLAAAAARCEPRSPLAGAVPALSEAVRVMLRSRDTAREVAQVMTQEGRRALVVGAGGSYGVAATGALLIRQAAWLPVDSMHLEDALQGGLVALNPGDLIVQIAPEGPANDRQADLAVVANTIGLERWKIGGSGDGARWHTPVPGLPEVVTPILTSVPLQWLALECSSVAGTDPDSLRRDDPRYEQAFDQISV